jgi:hypothetical protein
MNTAKDIFEYVESEEKNYETSEVRLGDNYHWSMRNHIQLIFHLKNNIFFTGENNWLRAFKNIMEPILNLSYWSEQIEVKDVTFYIEEEAGHVLSFLIKKYHDEVFVRKHNLDQMFEEITESDLDYGGALVQKSKDPKPETIELNAIAFCDQTDIEGGPIAFKHNFSPDKLRGMSKVGWGKESNGATVTIEELITLAEPEKNLTGTTGMKSKITGKNIEVYVIRGDLPEHYLKDNDNMDDWYNQLQIVAFYYGKREKREGVVLYRRKEAEGNLKFHTSKKVYGRALGRGVGETLLHPQIWTNFFTIHKTNMLEAGSKVPLYTDDPAYTQRQKIQDMENLEITTIEDGKKIYQVPTAAPANVALFDQAISEWQVHAQSAGAATDPMLGKNPPSGTAFATQKQAVQQGQGIHNYRKGKRAKFIESIYRDWIIPEMVKEMNQGQTFIASLSLDDLQWVTDALVTNESNKMIKKMVLAGQIPTPDIQQQFQQLVRTQLKSKGNKHLFEIAKGELEDIEIKIGIDIADKEKDLFGMVDKLVSVFQTITANPYILKSPPIAKLFNKIIEASGLQPIDLTELNIPRIPAMRVTERVDFKDMPPEAQQEFLAVAGYGGKNNPQPDAANQAQQAHNV